MLTNDDYAKAFHEIKNTITIIRSSLQLLQRQHPELSGYEYWNDSCDALDYLNQMIQELSQTKLSSDFPLQAVSPNRLLHYTISSLQSTYDCSSFCCECNIEPDLPAISGDFMRLNQALLNLIKNAFEAMGKTGTMQLNAYRKDDCIRIDIIDFGGGIKPDSEKQLFLPFYTSKPSGTGLGLPITKQIIEAHNGQLLFSSRPNEGCTFSVILPIA